MPQKLNEFLTKIENSLGKEFVLSGGKAQEQYGRNEMAVTRKIPAALKPATVAQVQEIVKTASLYGIPLYPFSTGNNWGYGAGTPVVDGCVVVDLSGMNRIVEMDEELGLVTVEPGVTPQDLRAYLDGKGMKYLVPVSGAGPLCSLLGNSLERGYGVTPYVDHFGAVMKLEAVLPDGTIYRSALTEMGGKTVDGAFKWGIGPYLDGIFSQGSYGIVTKMTIALAPIPEKIVGFLFIVRNEARLGNAVRAIRDILKRIGHITGSVNLMNARRLLSMVEPYPRDALKGERIMSAELVEELARKNYLGAWAVGGIIYGNSRLVGVAKKEIKRSVRGAGKGLFFFSRDKINLLKGILNVFPKGILKNARKQINNLDESFKVAEGSPTEIALPLCYWKSGKRPPKGVTMNPAGDGCGVIWYSPLVPMRTEDVCDYAAMVEKVCSGHGIEPLITLTSVSHRCFDSTVPILFDPLDPDESKRAHDCYRDLFEEGKKRGWIPYRMSIESMKYAAQSGIPFFDLARKLKDAIDPYGIISPGRYSKL